MVVGPKRESQMRWLAFLSQPSNPLIQLPAAGSRGYPKKR